MLKQMVEVLLVILGIAAWVVAWCVNDHYLASQGEWFFGSCPGGFIHDTKHAVGIAFMIPLVWAGIVIWGHWRKIEIRIERQFRYLAEDE